MQCIEKGIHETNMMQILFRGILSHKQFKSNVLESSRPSSVLVQTLSYIVSGKHPLLIDCSQKLISI